LLTAAACGGGATPPPTDAADMDAAAAPAQQPMAGEDGGEMPGAAPAPAGDEAPAPDAASPPPAVAEAAAAPMTCWYGPSVQHSPDGVSRTGAHLLLRRTYEPEDGRSGAGRIVEETVRFDAKAGVRPRLYRVVLTLTGNVTASGAATFELAATDGEYSGRGSLEGEPWAWTAWSSVYTLTSGIRLEAEQHLEAGDEGVVLVAERVAYGPDGSPALTLTERLARIDDEECARRLAEARDGEAP
jgi:hypothetical protein